MLASVFPPGDALQIYALGRVLAIGREDLAREAADAFVAQSRGALGVLSGPLNLGVIPTIAPYILPSLLKLLEEEYPDLEPRIVENQTEELLQRLRDGQIDVAVLATPTGATGVSEIPLYDETFAVITTPDHPLAGRDDLDDAELARTDGAVPLVPSKDGKAAQLYVPLDLGVNGFDKVSPAIKSLKKVANDDAGGMKVYITGPAGQADDFSKAFEGIDTTLLFAAGGVVII